MRRTMMLLLASVMISGCTQYKKLIGEEPHSENIPPCSQIAAQDFSGTDTEVMDQLTFDQKNRLDNTSEFFDARASAIEQVRNLYNGALPFPAEPQGFACLDQSEFNRVVEASANLGRFPL